MSDETKDGQLAVFHDMDMQRMFTDPVDAFTDEQAASAWAMIDVMEKVVEARKKELREALLHRAKQTGTLKENGSYEVTMGKISVTSERRVDKLPNEEVVKACLKEAGLEYEDAFTAQMVWTMDPSKVEFLVQGGKLPEDKISASKKETFALKVKPDKEIKQQLDNVKKRLTNGG